MPKQDDEINLVDSLSFFTRAASSFKNAIAGFFRFSLKNFILLLVFLLIGFAGGFVHYKLAKPVYFSELIVSSNYLPNDFCAELVEQLQGYVDDDTPELLAKKLEIDSADAEGIVKLQFSNFDENLAEKYKDRDTIVLGLPFKIKVYVSDFNLYPKLQPGLIGFFERNPYSEVERNIRLTNTNLLIEKIRKESSELDSLKKVVSSHLAPRGTQGGFVFGQPLDPINIYREVITLYKEELEKSAELIIKSNNLRVYSGFEVREKPHRPKLLLSIGIFALTGIFLGYVIALVKRNRKK